MSEILEEYGEQKPYSWQLAWKFTLITIVVVCFGIYVGNMMFGKRSLDVMLSLQAQKQQLKDDVETLKKQNAQLQKTYFELKELEP